MPVGRRSEKWFPDAYIFTLVGVVLVAVLAMINGATPIAVASSFGGGFWDLTAFTMKMSMVVLTGYVVATSPPVARLIRVLARVAKSPRTAVAWVALLAMLVSFVNWGLSLVFAGLLARAIARRTDLRVDYRALGAAGFMGLGAVWALGMPSSAAQLQATPASIPESLLAIPGVLDSGTTIFTWQPMLSAAILVVITVIIAAFSTPQGATVKTAQDLGIDPTDEQAPHAAHATGVRDQHRAHRRNPRHTRPRRHPRPRARGTPGPFTRITAMLAHSGDPTNGHRRDARRLLALVDGLGLHLLHQPVDDDVSWAIDLIRAELARIQRSSGDE